MDRWRVHYGIRNCKKILVLCLTLTSTWYHKINSITCACYIQLHNVGRIRKYLTTDATATLINAFFTSRLDNCNSLLFGCLDHLLQYLQMVQYSAARLIAQQWKFDHITPILINLHLLMKARITYKICLFVYKCLDQSAPIYLQQLVTPYQPKRELRSADQLELDPPKELKQKQQESGHLLMQLPTAGIISHLIWESVEQF